MVHPEPSASGIILFTLKTSRKAKSVNPPILQTRKLKLGKAKESAYMLAELGFQCKPNDPGPEALVITPDLKRVGCRTGIEQAQSEEGQSGQKPGCLEARGEDYVVVRWWWVPLDEL